ncbi:MAG: ribosome biogenesis GTPase Der [bacterium]
MSREPIVAIVGRPNVGKSTLFNRLTGRQRAIIERTPGVTRDRNYGRVEWRGRRFIVIDTGGWEPASDDAFFPEIREQVAMAISEADVILFVVDGESGIVGTDREIAQLLREGDSKEIILVVNKIDNSARESLVYEFYGLSDLGEVVGVSALHGRGSGALLDELVDRLPPADSSDEDEGDDIKVAVVGRPNVGKSSLINKILGEGRLIVSATPGTTRDSIDTSLEVDGHRFTLIDTAGIRRKSRVEGGVEYYSAVRSIRAIERSDVVVLLIDAVEGLRDQDLRIASLAHDAGCGLVLVVNKWDLVEKDDKTMYHYTRLIRERGKFISYAPILFVSALTGQRVNKVLDCVLASAEERSRRIPTGHLNRVVEEAVASNPPNWGRRVAKVYYATQVAIKPPTFSVFVSEPDSIHYSYPRYLENKLRGAFGFEGTPIRINFRPRRKRRNTQ